jgi:hypothetical protein
MIFGKVQKEKTILALADIAYLPKKNGELFLILDMK